LIGYARVSTGGQDTVTQEAKLKAAGCNLIRTETVSGGSRDGRSELASTPDFIRPGNVLMIVKLDRLGRKGLSRKLGSGQTRGEGLGSCSGRSCRLPILKRFASESAERISGNEMALDVECVLDCGMNGQEPLR
jgi:hypothetical protein